MDPVSVAGHKQALVETLEMLRFVMLRFVMISVLSEIPDVLLLSFLFCLGLQRSQMGLETGTCNQHLKTSSCVLFCQQTIHSANLQGHFGVQCPLAQLRQEGFC